MTIDHSVPLEVEADAPIAAEPEAAIEADVRAAEAGVRRGGLWRQLRSNRTTLVALIVLGLVVAAAFLAPVLAPHDPNQTGTKILANPSTTYWFGTDEVGRDLFSRMLYGTRFSLLASLLAVGISVVVGTTIGLISGYVGGAVDNVIMRVTDAVLAFPGLLLAMGIVGVLGPGVRNAMIGLSIAFHADVRPPDPR